ncbi:universal stress protein [bacterium]|nr:universal stress protein [bacterium]
MQVYRKILVTIDCSSTDEAIIEHVSALAIQNSAEVYLLHVVHSHTLDQHRALTEKADGYLETYCKTLKSKGIQAHTVVRDGEPDEQILAEIEKKDYDLVAMATHGHTFIGDLLFGSVSRHLKHNIKIPLLLLKQDG